MHLKRLQELTENAQQVIRAGWWWFSEKGPTEAPCKMQRSQRACSYFHFPSTRQSRCRQNHATHHGSSFSETTLDCLLRFAAFTETIERHDGAHHGLRTFWSPFKHATLIRRSSLQSVMKSPHFMWHILINRSICSVVNVDMLSRYSPLIPFSLKIWR